MKKIDWQKVKRRINFELICALADLDPILNDPEFQMVATIVSAVVGSLLGIACIKYFRA